MLKWITVQNSSVGDDSQKKTSSYSLSLTAWHRGFLLLLAQLTIWIWDAVIRFPRESSPPAPPQAHCSAKLFRLHWHLTSGGMERPLWWVTVHFVIHYGRAELLWSNMLDTNRPQPRRDWKFLQTSTSHVQQLLSPRSLFAAFCLFPFAACRCSREEAEQEGGAQQLQQGIKRNKREKDRKSWRGLYGCVV